LGKKALRQQRGSPVGEGLLPLPTANGEAVGEADGVSTVGPRRGFASSFSFPTTFLLGKKPYANSRTLPSVLGFWAVGEDFFPDSRVFLLGKSFFANSSGLGCWERSGLLAKPHFPVVKQGCTLCSHRETTIVSSGAMAGATHSPCEADAAAGFSS
jgi:hypothetical protein